MGAELGAQVPADPTGKTAVPGVWVAGNVGDLQAGVVQAISQGVLAAAAINGDLIAEDTAQAVETRRAAQPSLTRPERTATPTATPTATTAAATATVTAKQANATVN